MKSIVWLLALAVASGVSATESGPVVATTLGQLRGVTEEGIQVYRGIPYAVPPVGNLRWRAPQPVKAWEGIKDAGDYGPVCPQMRETRYPEDEDCLTLNVWTPGTTGEQRPVMVWIHGGAHVNGSGRTNAQAFARDGVVLVSLNYRLGRFGVYAHPDLTGDVADGEPTGNFGLLDQIAALEWVQREIAAFGGDPERVTIFGVSAGGSYVNLLMTSPLADGLFQRAIAQSGANGLARLRSLEALELVGRKFARRKGAESLRELRELPWQEVRERHASYRAETNPIVDGVAIVADVGETFRQGRQHNVPYLAGANSFEGSLAAAIPIPAYERIVRERADEVTRVYAMAVDDPALLLAFYGDALFVAPTRYLAKHMSTVPAPGWLYHFDYVLESMDDHVPGARHGGEVAFVFDRLATVSLTEQEGARFGVAPGEYPVSARDDEVAAMLHRYWIQFATTGSPNRTSQPVWPAYHPDTGDTLVIANEGTQVRRGVRAVQLDLIERGFSSRP